MSWLHFHPITPKVRAPCQACPCGICGGQGGNGTGFYGRTSAFSCQRHSTNNLSNWQHRQIKHCFLLSMPHRTDSTTGRPMHPRQMLDSYYTGSLDRSSNPLLIRCKTHGVNKYSGTHRLGNSVSQNRRTPCCRSATRNSWYLHLTGVLRRVVTSFGAGRWVGITKAVCYSHQVSNDDCRMTCFSEKATSWEAGSTAHRYNSDWMRHCGGTLLTLILPRSRTGTVWFYTSTSNKRAARPKLYTK